MTTGHQRIRTELMPSPNPNHVPVRLFERTLVDFPCSMETLQSNRPGGIDNVAVPDLALGQLMLDEVVKTPTGPFGSDMQVTAALSFELEDPIHARSPLTFASLQRLPRADSFPSRDVRTSRLLPSNYPAEQIVCQINCTDGDTMGFECRVSGCNRRFSRWPDFKRHYDGAHAVRRPEYWCPESLCGRSQMFGNAPFPRKDKLIDHAFRQHGISLSGVNGKRRREE